MKSNTAQRLAFVPAALAMLATAAFALPSCTADGEGAVDSEELVGIDDTNTSTGALSDAYPVGSTLKSTANVNLRNGPSTDNSILHVVPSGSTVELVESSPKNGFYKIKHDGSVGWSSGKYYSLVNTGGSEPLSAVRADAIARAKTVVGFSYWWGHGRWKADGATASNKGSCSGSCPSCSHSGSYGADCSGFAAKVWQVPASNSTVSTDSHPYSTVNFNSDGASWSTIARDKLKAGDALVYNSNGAGHIVIYESGDGWGNMYAYECKGCSAGCVYNLRTASSSYHAIRRAGW